MALKDLIRPAPTPAAERPPGITCEKYTRGEGKRCSRGVVDAGVVADGELEAGGIRGEIDLADRGSSVKAYPEDGSIGGESEFIGL